MGIGVDILHETFFQLSPGERLSGRLSLDPWLAVLVPLSGGILFGIASEVIARWRPEREVDPIEANALHGGRMSLIGSMIVAAQTMWSSGVGASVGLEAGYTQIASGIASRIATRFACAAATCVSWSVAAPPPALPAPSARRSPARSTVLSLIIGSYSPNSLAPVGHLGVDRFLVAQHFSPAELGVVAPRQDDDRGP